MSTQQVRKIVEYYEAAGTDYKWFWFSPEDLALHFGYYDHTVRNHRASLLKMNEVLAGYAPISASDRVLDAGCGYGGSAIWLARKGNQVTGITVVAEQVSSASRFALLHGLGERVSFAQMDFTSTIFPDASFDVVWALESLVHSDNKEGFFHEAYRLLRPGGRLVVADYTLREDPPLLMEQRASLTPWLEGWAMAGLLSAQEYTRALQACDFIRVETRDITEHIRPSVNWLGKLHVPTFPVADIAAVLGRTLCWIGLYSRVRLLGIEAGVCMHRALRAGLWRYTLLRAQK
jgi:tocopherol O-methyltransferase